ncbi:hypothetical protein PO909_032819 [Leuciscus waleckii]
MPLQTERSNQRLKSGDFTTPLRHLVERRITVPHYPSDFLWRVSNRRQRQHPSIVTATGGVSITGETECETESSGRRGNKRIRGVPGFHAGLKKPGLQKREGPGPIFPPPPPPPPPTEGQI